MVSRMEGIMKRVTWVYLAMVAVVFMAGACATAEKDQMSAIGNKMTDSDLEKAIKTELNTDPDLRAADLKVKADVDRNDVKLSGTVESEALRTRAVEMARSSRPGLVITDQID